MRLVPTPTTHLLMSDSESEQKFRPLAVHDISVSKSPSAHVFATLDTVAQADKAGVKEGLYGKDVMVWGGNSEWPISRTISDSI